MKQFIKSLILTVVVAATAMAATAQNTLPYLMPQRIKQGEGAGATYLDKAPGSWQNCTSADPGAQDSTCVVPYRRGVAAGLATVTASFSKANPSTISTGTKLIWTTANAVRLTVNCSGVASYVDNNASLQNSPSVTILNSATAGVVSCLLTAYNSDNEPATATATATFVLPAPPTITASFSNPLPYSGVDQTTAIWTSTNAKNVYVACTGVAWAAGYVPLSSAGGFATFSETSTGLGNIDCTFTATNELGQTASALARTQFIALPPPTANIWFTPASIKAGESSSVSWNTANAVYVGIVCSGVEINYSGAQTPNAAWYWNPITFPTQGVQECGIQSINAAGMQTFTNAQLYIYPVSGVLGGSPASSTTVISTGGCSGYADGVNGCEPPGPGNAAPGDDG